ncbi:cell division protein FtsQ/DivIB [Enterovirga sp.]|uniref:cell division protein FtsQ/DivIB n=1 Tax=Enterovirga sp. TaxID=2026350 RepID=UPI00260C4A41|nr:cell division protein FtsQ/DivIB [Enterovirga sp.]MDB5592745.1 Polypeptide-transport-associated domain protein FtsQ-type [Enterovirga sp.]
MDGGGRVLEPLTGFAGSGGFRPSSAARPSLVARLSGHLLRLSPPFASLRRRRRNSVAVPLARRIPRLAGTGLALGFFGLVGAYGLVLNGQYDELVSHYGDPRDIIARSVGLGVDKITISGLGRLPESYILDLAGITPRSSLPFLSAATARDRLLADPFIQSAEIRKLYPGEVIINLSEREPYALWQRDGELFVIARDGTAIDRLRDRSLAMLPLVVGDKANIAAPGYLALLDAAGPLRTRVRAGMLVSGRRWTLKMDNGLDVRLPEEGAVAAMTRLVRLEREAAILSKDVLTIDLRMADRVVVRLTEEAAAARAEAVKKRLQRGVKGIET